jgi:hypothetical protein
MVGIKFMDVCLTIDADIANGLNSTANTSVPAEFAGFPAVERFISNVGLNNETVFRKMHSQR